MSNEDLDRIECASPGEEEGKATEERDDPEPRVAEETEQPEEEEEEDMDKIRQFFAQKLHIGALANEELKVNLLSWPPAWC